MLNKRIMLLAIFLITLFALSAVSASENITDSIAETDEYIN